MLFESFFIGGFECSTHVLHDGRRVDVTSATHHDTWAVQDYERLKVAGIRTARDGVRWHLLEPRQGHYDFASALPLLRAARETGVQVIWDLLHFGWPDDVDVWTPAFITRFADFARAFAKLCRDDIEGVPFFAPVNEMSFLAFAGGQAGFFNPFGHGRGDEIKAQFVRASIAAMDAIWEVLPHARIVHTDPLINIIADPTRPEHRADAEHHRQSQFASWDMLYGKVRPELGGNPRYLDIVGANYYVNNQWIHTIQGHSPVLVPSHPNHLPLRYMLREVHARYGRPVFIAETGIENAARPEWLRYIGREALGALQLGVPLEGVCLYPIVNHPGWDDDRHCHNGLWDYADEHGVREAFPPLQAELANQEAVFRQLLEHGHALTEASLATATEQFESAAERVTLDEAAEDAEKQNSSVRGV